MATRKPGTATRKPGTATRKPASRVQWANFDFHETELSNPIILFHHKKLVPPKIRISKLEGGHKDNSKDETKQTVNNVSTFFENTESTSEAQKGDALCKDARDTGSSCTTSAESSDNIVFQEPDQVNKDRQLEGQTRKIGKPYKISYRNKLSRKVRAFLNPSTKQSFRAKYPSRNKKINRYSTFGALNNEKTDKTYKIRYRNESCKMRPCQIEFTKQHFRAKYPGRNKTVFSTFGALKYEKVRVEDLPKIRVFRYGNNCYTPDNRWLFLFQMFAPVYKMRHGVDLRIPVLFIERLQRLEVSKKLGVSRCNISLKRLPKYDNLKEEPKKFKLYLRPKRGQVKKLEPRGIRLTKAEINQRRRGQIPSMNFDIHPDPDVEPEYIERRWRKPVTIGDYIEKCIGDRLREYMINKDFSFSNTARINFNTMPHVNSRSQSRHSGSDNTANKPASKTVGDKGTRQKTTTRGQQAKPKSKNSTQANSSSGQNMSSNQHRKKKGTGQKDLSNLHTPDASHLNEQVIYNRYGFQNIPERKVKRATESSESRGDKHVSEKVFDKGTKANTKTNDQQTKPKSKKRIQANATSGQYMTSDQHRKNKGNGQSDIGNVHTINAEQVIFRRREFQNTSDLKGKLMSESNNIYDNLPRCSSVNIQPAKQKIKRKQGEKRLTNTEEKSASITPHAVYSIVPQLNSNLSTGHVIPSGKHPSSTAQLSATLSKDVLRNSQVATSVSRSASFKFLKEPSQHDKDAKSFRKIPKQLNLEVTPQTDDRSVGSAEKGGGKIETSFGLQKVNIVSLNSTSDLRQSGEKLKQKKRTEAKSSARQELKTVESAEAIPSANDQRRPVLTHSMGSSWAVITSPVELVDGCYVRTSKKIEFTEVRRDILKGKTRKKRNKKGNGIYSTIVNPSNTVSCQEGNIKLTANPKTTTVSHTESINGPGAKPKTATLSQPVDNSSLGDRQNATPSHPVDYSSLGARPKTTTLSQPVNNSSLSDRQNATPSHPVDHSSLGIRPKTTTLSQPVNNSSLSDRQNATPSHRVDYSSLGIRPKTTTTTSHYVDNSKFGARPKTTTLSQPLDNSRLGTRPETTTLSQPLDNSRLGTRPETSLPHPVYNSILGARPSITASSSSLNNRIAGARPKTTTLSNREDNSSLR